MIHWDVITDVKICFGLSLWCLKKCIFSKVFWIHVLGEIHPIPNDVKFMLSIIISKMKSTDFCLCIICTQMVLCEAFSKQANHICQNTLCPFQHLMLSSNRKVVSLDQWISYHIELTGHLQFRGSRSSSKSFYSSFEQLECTSGNSRKWVMKKVLNVCPVMTYSCILFFTVEEVRAVCWKQVKDINWCVLSARSSDCKVSFVF